MNYTALSQDDFQQRAAEVAAALSRLLNEEWTAGDTAQMWGSESVPLLHSDETLMIVNGKYGSVGRLTVIGSVPDAWRGYGYDSCPEITLSAAKGAATIARDIVRRLLPGYLALMDRARARATAQRTQEAACAGLAAQLMAWSSGHLVPTRDGAQAKAHHYLPKSAAPAVTDWMPGGSVDAEVFPSYLHLKFSYMLPDVAERVVRALFEGAEPLEAPVEASRDNT